MIEKPAQILHFIKVLVWKHNKILVEFHHDVPIGCKYTLPTFMVDIPATGADVVRNSMRTAYGMSVTEVVDTGHFHTAEVAANLFGSRPFSFHERPTIVNVVYMAADYQSMLKDVILTVEPPSTVWMSARVAHALFVKHHVPNAPDAHIQYLSKFL